MPDSLRSTLTKLLALEDTFPAFHEFGCHLLSQRSSLEGLQSLLPDPDAFSALELTEIHFPDQKPHLDRQPISSYLYCLKQFSPETQAYQWGVNTLIACCILISINPSAAAEHQATITTLVNRFRLASQALHKTEQNGKLFKYDKLYLWLWGQLPQTPTSLEAFFQQLCGLEQSGTLDTFQFNLIQDIRRAYSYVLI